MKINFTKAGDYLENEYFLQLFEVHGGPLVRISLLREDPLFFLSKANRADR